jgi:urease beta subunit
MKKTNYTITDIKFPIVVFEKTNAIFFARAKGEITICTAVAFKAGFYKDLQLIDSNGFFYKITDAIKVGTVGLFWGYNIFLNQKIEVELIVSNRSDRPIELDELKSRIIKVFKENSSFWDSDGLLQKRLAFVQKANSYLEIIEELSNEFYKKH